jgi:hypothetical protein
LYLNNCYSMLIKGLQHVPYAPPCGTIIDFFEREHKYIIEV